MWGALADRAGSNDDEDKDANGDDDDDVDEEEKEDWIAGFKFRLR